MSAAEEEELKIIGEANPKQREKLLSLAYVVTTHLNPDAIGQAINEMCTATTRRKVKQKDGSWDWGDEEPDHYQRAIGLKLAADYLKHATEHTVGKPKEKREITLVAGDSPAERARRIRSSPAAMEIFLEEAASTPEGQQLLLAKVRELPAPAGQ